MQSIIVHPAPAQIRTASVADADAICHVIRRSITECCVADHCNDPQLLDPWLSNKTPENVRRWIETAGAISVVALVQDGIAGVAMASAQGEVLLCYLIPEARFTGTGRAMLAAIEARATAAGITVLHLESTQTARSFYGRNGFVTADPGAIAEDAEDYFMRKQIAQTNSAM
jgi:N-acetylglutamate synthase-like GNAT family acetyltransferase